MSLKKEDSDKIGARRRTEILNAAMQLFDEQGYGNTSVSQIAAKANISKGLIYHYFKSKLEILKATIDIVEEAKEYLWAQESLADAIYINLFRLCHTSDVTGFYPPLRVMYAAAVENSISPGDFRDVEYGHIFTEHLGAEVFTKCIQDAQARGEIAMTDPKKLADFIWSYCLGIMMQVLYAKNKIDLREATNYLMELLPKQQSGS